MAGAKRKASASASGARRVSATSSPASSGRSPSVRRSTRPSNAVPSIYRDMVKDAIAEHADEDTPTRPLKRPRSGVRVARADVAQEKALRTPGENKPAASEEDEEEELEFEDVLSVPALNIQTMEKDSDDEDDDDDDIEFEDVNLESETLPRDSQGKEIKSLVLDLSKPVTPRRAISRRKPTTRAEKERRVEIHKMHLLCLLSHVGRRNHWCNDPEIQETLQPLLSEKMVKSLNPKPSANQFSRSESLKSGILEARTMFRSKFTITERGLRRALWAEDEEQLQNYEPPDDLESTFDKGEFLEAAKSLRGSRDVGAQLFCAMLRGAGVEARLVCSLQPLAFAPGAPIMPKKRGQNAATKAASRAERYKETLAKHESQQEEAASTGSPSSARHRLGHAGSLSHDAPSVPISPSSRPKLPDQKQIRGESAFPVYWVEVLDVAYQKWQPVDPLVTGTQWKPRSLEPPASDKENCMSYVMAFEADGSAKDVTRRYVKAYHSKTLKTRLDGFIDPTSRTVSGASSNSGSVAGERWWRKLMRLYRKPFPTDVDEIENNELASAVANEPLPRNVVDFKDHPVYALERHLRRHEVIAPNAQFSGTVSAGNKGQVERIYRRRDVRIVRSRDKWYRLGRLVRPDENAVKILPKRASKRSMFDDDVEEDDPDKVGLFGDEVAGTPCFMYDQTDPCIPPPVIDGIVPKNKFGNIDVYVPSMVPAGGVHIVHERAAEAAFKLGVDYAPALTGFQFKGRHGTAVLRGVVVPKESEEGVRAAITGLEDMEEEVERERRTLRALRMWSRFLKALRIRERIWANVDPEEMQKLQDGAQKTGDGEEGDDGEAPVHKDKGNGIALDEDLELDDAPSDVSEVIYMGEDDEGGGFLIE